MKSQTRSSINELLIVSLAPQNLEREVLWFAENFASIKKARISNLWWRDNSLIIETGLILKLSEFTRQLFDFGYDHTQTVVGKGLYAVRGSIVEVWPINTEKPYLIEFVGNKIETIRERTEKLPEAGLPIKGMVPLERMKPGSYVVHIDHGIGIFRGITENPDEIPNKLKIQNLNYQNGSEDKKLKTENHPPKNSPKFFVVEYAPPAKGRQPDMLYVPASQKDRLSPYIGFTTPIIHRLGGTVWFKTKHKARENAQNFAKKLLEIYSKRHRTEREPPAGDDSLEKALRNSFPHEETIDQIRAEEEIKRDLKKRIPMDRILCGDVGFGKTELALRAIIKIVASGKQAAVLAPTTVLASQHEKTFTERLKNIPVKIAMLSRLTPPAEKRQILKELAEGQIDCIIGTHRILSQDVKFKNLGLVVIDEEQRFGVKQKEHFKEMRSEIDILSLSATPIPRTLYLALTKLRDISVIETPPPERLPIKTLVLPYSSKIIQSAIQYELSRGGQVYFLHNRIETLATMREKIKNMLSTKYPKSSSQRRKEFLKNLHETYLGIPCSDCNNNHYARSDTKRQIGIIHGRMKEKEIIRVMDQFRNGEIKILLATTIIENGLDISSVNTLIVDDATRLGLAEAHQLRGRIGRGNRQAFAYFLYKPRHLTPKTLERLEALKTYSDLGSGYQIALRDLEIRGAGNVLGKEQSGSINKVGLNLYCQILAETVEERLKNTSSS